MRTITINQYDKTNLDKQGYFKISIDETIVTHKQLGYMVHVKQGLSYSTNEKINLVVENVECDLYE